MDPNVLVATLLSPDGTPARIYLAFLGGSFELIVSPQLISELDRVLAYPKLRQRVSKLEAEEFVEVLARLAFEAEDPTAPPSVTSSDPGDDYLLGLAEAESAVLVSGDSHILRLKADLPIYSPSEFLELIAE